MRNIRRYIKLCEVLCHCYSIQCATTPVNKKSHARFQTSATMKIRSLLFLVVMQPMLVIVYERPLSLIFKGTYRLSQKSINIYQHTLRNNPEERRLQELISLNIDWSSVNPHKTCVGGQCQVETAVR
jgi:hypothetical protein